MTPEKSEEAGLLEQWVWVRAAIADALRPYPEALAAVIAALARYNA